MDNSQALGAQAVVDGISTGAGVASTASSKRTRIRLWDLPLRVFHWSLVLAVVCAVVTGQLGGSWMDLHGKAGLTIVGLVVFRVVWGLIGSTHARFVHFAPTPARLMAYVRGRWKGVGHNPLGALSVFALLSLLAVQATTGLFSSDDIAFSGPLFNLVDEALANRLMSLHRQFANVLLAFVGLHVAAIAFYVFVKKTGLVKPMVTGWKEVDDDDEPSRQGGPIAFVVALVIAVAAVWAVSGAVQSWLTPPAPAASPSSRATPAW